MLGQLKEWVCWLSVTRSSLHKVQDLGLRAAGCTGSGRLLLTCPIRDAVGPTVEAMGAFLLERGDPRYIHLQVHPCHLT